MDGKDRETVLRAAVEKVGGAEVRAALAAIAPGELPKPVGNSVRALRRHPDPAAVVGRAQYRAALPYLAAAISDPCLTRTIEALGDHSDDPTRDQLAAALDVVRDSCSDVTIAVMLASVANGDMPSSDLCFDIVSGDARYDLAGPSDPGPEDATAPSATRAPKQATPEEREARRQRRHEAAAGRRKRTETAQKAAEQVRRARRRDRSGSAGGGRTEPGPSRVFRERVPPRLLRRAILTPVQEEEFDRSDPWVAGIVFAWVPFDSVDPAQPELTGKWRRCVVVAGSGSHLLVRPGYSSGGVRSRDWRSVPITSWKRAGFDQPTWIGTEPVRVVRDQEHSPAGWLSPEDWNALW